MTQCQILGTGIIQIGEIMAKKEQYMVVGRPLGSLKEEVWTTYATSRVDAMGKIQDMKLKRDHTDFVIDFVFTPAQVRDAKV